MINMTIPDWIMTAGGWALVHSLWQGVVITLLLILLLNLTEQRAPRIRYTLSVGALLLQFLAVVVTFCWYLEPGVELAASGEAAAFDWAAYLASATPAAAEALPPTWTERLNTYLPYLVQLWMIGVLLMAMRMLTELGYLYHIKHYRTRDIDGPWAKRLEEYRQALGIRLPVALKETMRGYSPMVIGLWRPVILMPVGLLANLTPAQVECILAHELAHVRRHDFLINLLQSLIEVLLFFNPAVWWLSGQIREEREHCCDEMALELTGDRLTLARTLAQLEEWRMAGGTLALAFNGRYSATLGRVRRLLQGDHPARVLSKSFWGALLLSACLVFTAFQTQEEPTAAVEDQEDITTAPAFAAAKPTIPAEPPVAPAQPSLPALPVSTGDIALSELPSLLMSRLPTRFFTVSRDTVPLTAEQRATLEKLQREMEALQQQMENSPEMKELQELGKKMGEEMQAFQEKWQQEHGELQKMSEKQQAMAEEIQAKVERAMESEAWKNAQAEVEKFHQEMDAKREELERKYPDDREKLEAEMEALEASMAERGSRIEEQFELASKELEAAMEEYENSDAMRELERYHEELGERMEAMSEEVMQNYEARMEELQELLESKYFERLEELSEKMEELHKQRRKAE